jgi:RNA polymerase sigma factor for flagellar operon FliA
VAENPIAGESVPPRTEDRRRASNARLWRQWRRHGDERAREQLIESLMGLAAAVCQRRARAGLPTSVDAEDMLSAAYVGLIRAIERYDPAHGAAIESFVWGRCEGAVLDWMRRESPSTRSQRNYERRRDAVQARLGRRPSEADLASALGLPGAQVRRRELERVMPSPLSLDDMVGDEASGDALSLVADDRNGDPEASMELRETQSILRSAVDRLSDNERIALVAHTLGGAPLRDVSRDLGLSRSRISQLRARAIRRLRADLEPHRELLRAA